MLTLEHESSSAAPSASPASDGIELPPLDTRFQLGTTITPVQEAFLARHGFLVFERVASPDEVRMIIEEMARIEREWLAERREKAYGIPIFYGRAPDGRRIVQRFTFSSMFSPRLRAFVRDQRFEPIRRLIGEDARIGDDEKDGVVINTYINSKGSIYKRLGWHTDGLRDVFYGRLPQRQLNVGLHFDRCDAANGGLRLIPGSHEQGMREILTRKIHFVSQAPDPDEICVETEPGDLTIHDGRLWHRVARSQHAGMASLRRSMYVPYLTGPYEPKSEASPTPPYHKVFTVARGLQRLWA